VLLNDVITKTKNRKYKDLLMSPENKENKNMLIVTMIGE
jgi:hypothetical protein